MPMIRCSAPLRLSIAGGGTDLPEYQSRYGCHLLAASLNLRVGVTLKSRSDGAVSYDGAKPISLEQESSVIGAILRRVHPSGADLRIDCPVSAGAGLGGSGALGSALVAALLKLAHPDQEPACEAVAHIAYEVERHDFGARVGMQDHMVAVHGGLVRLRIDPGGAVSVTREAALFQKLRRMCKSGFLLMDTGIRRSADAVLSGLAKDLEVGVQGTVHRAMNIGSLLPAIESCIAEEDLAGMGHLMHQHWLEKCAMNKRSSDSVVDHAYAHARRLGAYGGKLVGAGAGGFLLMLCPPDRREAVLRELTALGFRHRPIALEDVGLRCEWSEE